MTAATVAHLQDAAGEMRADDPMRVFIDALSAATLAQDAMLVEMAAQVANMKSEGALTEADINALGQRCARAVGGMAQSELRQAAKRWLHDGLLVMAVVNAVFLLTGIAIGLSAVYLAEAPPGFTCADKPDGSRFCWKWTRLPPNHHD